MRIARERTVFPGIFGVVALLGGLGLGASLAHDSGTIHIVTEDQNGNRHERTIEYDDDEPRAFLGVSTDDAHDGGARIKQVFDDTAAQRAGLQEGDVIVGIDGASIDSSWDLLQEVIELQPGDRVGVEILRDGRAEVLDVELGEREAFDFDFDFDFSGLEKLEGLGEHLEGLGLHLEDLGERLEGMDIDIDMPELRFLRHHGSNRPKLGVQLVQPTADLRRHFGAPDDVGVMVSKVLRDTPAEEAGIEVGDIIVSADGRKIRDVGDLIGALRGVDRESFELELIRDGASLRLDAYIPMEPED